jgi:predicted PolB exonuclease-like 3'-5' exonuclease
MKLIAKDIYCYDAEWIPCTRTGRLLTNLPESATDEEIFLALWKRAGATPEKPHPFLKLAISRVVSISAIHRHVNGDGTVTLALRSYPDIANPDRPEGVIISSFLEEVAQTRGQLVGYNAASSDLPIFVQRGIANGCTCPTFGKRPDKPWLGLDYLARFSEAHLDLAHILTAGGFGSSVMPSLDEIAAASSIPGKLDHAGGGVLDLWTSGRYAELTGYNETDACTTYLLWLRTAWFLGKITAQQRDAELSEFNRLLRKLAPTRPHLTRFLEVWRARRATAPELALLPSEKKAPPALIVVAAWEPEPQGGRRVMAGTCEFPINVADLDSETTTRLNRHLVSAGTNRSFLCRIGHDHEGKLVAGRDAAGGPLLLPVTSRDLAGVLSAVARAGVMGVDEWDSPEAA